MDPEERARRGRGERLRPGGTVHEAGRDNGGGPPREARVLREQVDVLYRRLPLSLLASLVNAGVLAMVLHDSLPGRRLGGWLAAVAGVALLRAALWGAARRRGIGPDTAAAWGDLHIGLTALNGVVWGSAALLLWVSGSLALQLLVAVVLAGMVAGGAAANASRQAAFLAFAVPVTAPMIVRLLLAGDRVRMTMGLLLVVLTVFLFGTARAGGRAIGEAVRFRLENEDLLVSLRRRSERRLARFRTLLEQAGVGILVADPDTHRIIDANVRAADLLGLDLDGLLACRLHEVGLVSKASAEAWTALIEKIRTDGARTLEDRAEHETGERWLETVVDVRPFGDQDFVLLVLRDVSDRKGLERGLTRASLLASVGTLAAGTAHEINNPLSYVMGNLEYLGMLMDRSPGGWPSEEKVRESLSQAMEGADQIRRVVRDLGQLARTDAGVAGPLDLREVIESCVSLALNEIRHRARLTLALPPLPAVLGDRMQLTQVFLNLLVNAAQAIPPGDVDGHRISVTATEEEGFVRVEVSDTGEGMSPEVTERAFEPFFTTRPVGSGMGLGLSVAHGLVSSLGGRMEARSREGRGTVFVVHLPLAAAAEAGEASPDAAEADASDAESTSPDGARVLVVDDDQAVAKTLARTLEPNDVAVAGSCREALDRIDEASFDVVVCDLVMPDLSGVELYREATSRHPELEGRFAFITGGTFTEETRRFMESVSAPVLEKPFELHRVRAVVARLAARGAARS